MERFEKPVIILGAPRSGTSLLHRILRDQPGFVSTARESKPVWQPLIHPKNHEWRGEAAPAGLTSSEIDAVHRELAKLALSADVWRRADARNVVKKQQNPLLSRWLLSPGYRAMVMFKGLRWRKTMQSRLVDKSVHSGLWPTLLDTCFPDARYIHIVRHPAGSIPSMIDGWLDPERFFTYSLPEPLAIPDYPFKSWNFPLPTGWRQMREAPLAEVVSFQWRSIQEGILSLQSRCAPERFLRIQLEDLSARPRETLEEVAGFLGLPWSVHLEAFAARMPIVNARRTGDAKQRLEVPVESVLPGLDDLAEQLGCHSPESG